MNCTWMKCTNQARFTVSFKDPKTLAKGVVLARNCEAHVLVKTAKDYWIEEYLASDAPDLEAQR
jgi:hypothetical protein